MRILLYVDYSRRSELLVSEVAERSWPPGTVVRVLAVVDNAPPSAAELLFDAGGSLETVMRLRRPQESLRNPTWFRPDLAKHMLAKRREFRYGNELSQVIDKAISRIQQAR